MEDAPAIDSLTLSDKCQGCFEKAASSMSCPTCLKLGIKTSLFCTQECFKTNWASHKAVHATAKQNGMETHDPFQQSIYTGSLRACYPKNVFRNVKDPKSRRAVPKDIPRPNYADDVDGNPRYSFKESRGQAKPRQLESWEQEGMRRVCKLAREVLDHAASFIRPGITTDELDAIVHQACIDRKAYPSPLNYRNFPRSVCTSVNEVICHGIPDMRPLQEGDIVNLDITLYYGGFHGDLNATYPVGKVDDDSIRLMKAARESLDEAIRMCKPGALYRDIGKVIEPIAKKYGCTVNKTYCGHGINNLFHCAPNVPHYAQNRAAHEMKPGHTFTIEPMLHLGDSGETHWPDNWTAVTIDGKRSAQFEETLLITEDGVEVLTKGADKVEHVHQSGTSNGAVNGSS